MRCEQCNEVVKIKQQHLITQYGGNLSGDNEALWICQWIAQTEPRDVVQS